MFILYTMLPDIHTHTKQAHAIFNVSAGFDALPADGWYSAGLHPWYIDATTVANEFDALQKAARQYNVLAIGECGLDKVCDTDFSLQQTWFHRQLLLAEEMQKPVIIHCVKAYDEVISSLQAQTLTVPVIFHGFQKSAELARRLISLGYYLSFGKGLMNETTAAVFAALPLTQVFLETDAGNIPIESVYEKAAALKALSLQELKTQICRNTTVVFGKNICTHEGY